MGRVKTRTASPRPEPPRKRRISKVFGVGRVLKNGNRLRAARGGFKKNMVGLPAPPRLINKSRKNIEPLTILETQSYNIRAQLDN